MRLYGRKQNWSRNWAAKKGTRMQTLKFVYQPTRCNLYLTSALEHKQHRKLNYSISCRRCQRSWGRQQPLSICTQRSPWRTSYSEWISTLQRICSTWNCADWEQVALQQLHRIHLQNCWSLNSNNYFSCFFFWRITKLLHLPHTSVPNDDIPPPLYAVLRLGIAKGWRSTLVAWVLLRGSGFKVNVHLPFQHPFLFEHPSLSIPITRSCKHRTRVGCRQIWPLSHLLFS